MERLEEFAADALNTNESEGKKSTKRGGFALRRRGSGNTPEGVAPLGGAPLRMVPDE